MCASPNDTTQNDAGDDSRFDTQESDGERKSDRWLGGPDVLDADLPGEMQSALGRFVGREAVETLGDLTTEIRRLTGGGAIAAEDLCHADCETDHWGTVDGERYHFRCFYDAVILAAIEERPVDIHTTTPGGGVVEARAVGTDELSVTPEEAVFSFGIGHDAAERSGGEPTVEDGYAAICPYVRAFPDREAYDQWADEVSAATVALPLAGATEVAGALVS